MLALLAVLAGLSRVAGGEGAPSLDLAKARFVFVKTPRIRFTLEWELRLAEPDTNLYTVLGDGTGLRPITRLRHASVRRPSVSFDGQRILFSMNPRGERGRWHLYECRADGSDLRQLTDGDCDDLEPFYLPDGRIAFLSTRADILDEYHRELATLLHVMGPDGGQVWRISSNLSHDLNPQLLSDGRICGYRWEHRNFRTHRFPLFTVRPDGAELFSFHSVRHRGQAPSREFCELPGGRLLLVEQPTARGAGPPLPSLFGRLVVSDPARGQDPERRPFLPRRKGGWLYRSPCTLPDGRIVAVRGRGDPEAPVEGGIVVLSPDGSEETLVYDDPGMIELYPVPLAPRETPPVAPSSVDWQRDTGTIASISVFRSELRHDNGSLFQPMGYLKGLVKAVRVVEGIPCKVAEPRSRFLHERGLIVPLNAEVSLGEAPLQADGSFYVEVPAGRALIFQALDENGMNLTFHKSWVSVMPGEQRLCMGCHEHRDHAPLNHMPLALRQPPVRVADRGEPVSYVQHVKPILDAKCRRCHDPGGPRSLRGTDFHGHQFINSVKGPLSRYIVPHYARDSYLVWKLYGRALSDGNTLGHVNDPGALFRELRGGTMPPPDQPQLSPGELRTLVLWIELGAYYGSFPPSASAMPLTYEQGHTVPASAGAADVPGEQPGLSSVARRSDEIPGAGRDLPRILAYPTAPSQPVPPPDPQPYGYKSPIRLALSPDGSRLFVSNHTAGTVAVVDPATCRLLREVEVGPDPVGLAVAPDGRTVYVAVRGQHEVVALDGEAGRVIGRLRVGYEPYGLCLSRDGTLLLVTNVVSGDLSIVETRGLRQLTRVPVSREPRSVALTRDGRLALVANALSPEPATRPDIASVVSVVDMEQGKVVGEVRPIDGNALRDIVVSPDGRFAYVAHQIPRFNVPTTQITQGWIQTNGLTLIQLGTRPRHLATVVLDTFAGGAANPCGLAITPDGRTLYVSHTGTHQITVVDLPRLHGMLAARPREVRKRMDPGLMDPRDLARDLGALARAGAFRRWEAGGLGPRGIALDPQAQRLYVASFFSDTVTVLDARSGALLHTIRIGPEKPMTEVRRGHFLFHDARRSCFQGWLSCASCHPEAGADGLNWDLLNDGIGNRKNAKMLIGSWETPPAMSTGIRPNMEAAVAKGFQFIQFRQHTPDEQEAVVAYLKWVRHRPSPFHRLPDGSLDASARRGKALFEDPRVGCAHCHPAPLLTDRKLYNVGTGTREDRCDTFDTPSLRELYRTGPYLHNGRAATLRDLLTTFNPDDRHGHTSHLPPDQLADLVAYLLSL